MLKCINVNQTTEKEERFQNLDLPDTADTLQSRWIIYALFIALSYISVTFAFNFMLAEPLSEERLIIHQRVIEETAPKPIQYRILTYYIVEAAHRITGFSIWRLDLVLRFIFTSFVLVFLFKYLRRWFKFATSALGSIILVALLPVTYVDYIHQPHDMPNLFFTILALTVIRDRKEAWLLVLIPVAMLNRESFILVLPVWVFYNLNRLPMKSLLIEFAFFALLAVVIYMALPHYYGPRDSYVDMLQIENNLHPAMILKWMIRLIVFLGPLTVAALLRFDSKPFFLRRAIWFVIIFMAVNFLFGMYQETRLFLPVLPIMIPLALATIFPAVDPDRLPYNHKGEKHKYVA